MECNRHTSYDDCYVDIVAHQDDCDLCVDVVDYDNYDDEGDDAIATHAMMTLTDATARELEACKTCEVLDDDLKLKEVPNWNDWNDFSRW